MRVPMVSTLAVSLVALVSALTAATLVAFSAPLLLVCFDVGLALGATYALTE